MIAQPKPDRLVAHLAALVAIPSENPPGGEKVVAEYVRDHLEPLGFTVRLEESAPGRFNAEAVLENGPGPVFAFNTHMDTVPAGQGWIFFLARRCRELRGMAMVMGMAMAMATTMAMKTYI